MKQPIQTAMSVADAIVGELVFVECDACRAKPGAPRLCAGCVRNRNTIDKLRAAIFNVHLALQPLRNPP